VHIAAVMACLDVRDLDHRAKHALLVVCCRADRRTGSATVSIGRIGADMSVAYHTAQHALERAVKAGYLTVDKSPGKTPKWRQQVIHTSAIDDSNLGNSFADHLGNSFAHEGVFREVQGSDARPAQPAVAVENQRHGRGCQCRGTGWIEVEDQAIGGLMVTHCPAKLTIVDG
jgi:hypothetical protein